LYYIIIFSREFYKI